MKKSLLPLFASLVLFVTLFPIKGLAAENEFYQLSAKSIDGNEVAFSSYKGKTLLIVNVASQCGYTPQYEGLQKLYSTYQKKNFLILGFPSNDFGSQEPGENKEIKKFCKLNYGVEFPLFAKSVVSGSQKNPIYKFLTKAVGIDHDEVGWNFEKFLVNKNGKVVARFSSRVKPDDKKLVDAIEKALNEK